MKAVLLAIAVLIVDGCGLSLLNGRRAIGASNPFRGADTVVRVISGQQVELRLLVSENEGILATQASAPTRVEFLDPISCRVISEVGAIPNRHTWIEFQEGTLFVSAFDPSDWGDPSAPGALLPATERCAESDAGAGAASTPSMTAGLWLGQGEMACTSTGAGPGFAVRGEFLRGAVEGCEAHRGDARRGPIEASGNVVFWNPDGNRKRLAFTWEAPSCSDGATVSFYPTIDGYDAHVIAAGAVCDLPAETYTAIFLLTDPIDAARVSGALERLPD